MLIDSKTNTPWPPKWANMALRGVKRKASADLVARDRSRGIPESGQVYTTESDEKGEHKRETCTVDRALAGKRHTGRESRILREARWREFCSKPQDLAAFKAANTAPEVEATEAAIAKAAPIEESLVKETGAATAPVSKSDSEPKPVSKLSKKAAKPKTAKPTE